MNKVLIGAMSKLFNVDEIAIETALSKDDGDDIIVKEYQTKYAAYTPIQLATMIDNAKKKQLEEMDFEITQVPKPLYDKIKVAALQAVEKPIASKHGIEKYDNLTDLLDKVSEKITSGKGNPDEATKQQIETLKAANIRLEKEKIDGIQEANDKFKGELITRDLSTALSSIQFDYEDDKEEAKSVLKKQQKLFDSAFKAAYKVDRKDESTIVLDINGKPVVDNLGSPKKVSDVMIDLATEYGFKLKTLDNGGRGTAGSPPNGGGNVGLKGKTVQEVYVAKGLNPSASSAEHDAAYAEWKAANTK